MQPTKSPFVKTTTRTTLEIDAHWFPVRILTAEQTICALMREREEFTDKYERVKVNSFCAMDTKLQPHDWASWYDNRAELVAEGKYPLPQSSKHVIPVPTILRIKTSYQDPNLKKVSRAIPTLKDFLIAHDYTCAISGIRYDPAEFDPEEVFNLDHIVPRHLGGPNDSSNLVLATKKENSKKGHKFPFYNVNGAEMKAKVAIMTKAFPHLQLKGVQLRPEWNNLLFKV